MSSSSFCARFGLTSALALTVLPALAPAQRPASQPSTQRPVTAASSEAAFVPISRAVHGAIDGNRAYRTVEYVQRFFRLPGNRGFDAAIDTVASLLRAAGYVREDGAPASARFVYRIESRPMANPAWTPIGASLTIAGRTKPLQQFSTNLNMIAINSGSTPEGGVTADVVDVGAGGSDQFAAVDVKGKIALSTGDARAVYPRALQAGAIGVLNTQALPSYNQQSKNTTAIRFTSVVRDSGWILYISSATHDSLRAAMKSLNGAPLRVHADVRTLFETRPELTIVAEIRGRTRPAERFVYSAHVQEPGANDNATGVGTQAEMARVAADLVRRGVANPQRTITFLWGDEIRSTDRFLKEDSVRRAAVKWGMSLDMVGENTALTGGTFLIEKMPDPSAVWVRGEDQHTEWGGKPLAEKDIRAYWFNDFVRQRCLDRARQTNWVVKANPFEGGSDHTPFLNAKIPAVLLWHFTDQYYHTDLDRIEMVSASTLANVGACALTTGLLLADGSRAIVLAALDELAGVAEQAIRTQSALSRDTLSRGGNADTEKHIIETWRTYYLDAIDKIGDIAVGPVDLTAAIGRAKARVRAAR
ncbi:M28 family peptidase [Gemmatimonas aurantiaca]|uniref:M28 family peptidase n=1 Tax=Gemmatimonas aurantiaca TaxID=173480 RepID=UPI00301C9028